jgi:hypothetical protein
MYNNQDQDNKFNKYGLCLADVAQNNQPKSAKRSQGLMYHLRRSWSQSWIIFLMSLLALVGWGCEEPKDRFEVPDYNREPIETPRYQVTGKIGIPHANALPLWSNMLTPQDGTNFKPDAIYLQGTEWLRNETSAFTLYFHRNNYMSGHSVSKKADSIAHFVILWFGKSFNQRLQIILIPQTRSQAQLDKAKKIPLISPAQIVIYSGADNDAQLSRYGLVGELLHALVRATLAPVAESNMNLFWRTLAIPAYFELRGTGAMISQSYDRTSTPKFKEILAATGDPSASELLRIIAKTQRYQLEALAQQRLVRAAISLLGFIEDAYGRHVLAGILRYLQTRPKESIEQAINQVIGKNSSAIWQEWSEFYYDFHWRVPLQIETKPHI